MPTKPSMLNYLDNPETEKKFKRFLRKEKRQENLPSEEEKEEIKKLERQALGLWRQVVKLRAGRKCEAPGCKVTKRLNAHHIESFITNRMLRTDPENGFCGCPGHHKFKWLSAHKSFCFMYELLTSRRLKSLRYLLDHYQVRIPITKEFLQDRVRVLALELGEKKGKK